MTMRAAINATLRGLAVQAQAYAVMSTATAVHARFVAHHDPKHYARTRRRGRWAQRALWAWAEGRGMRVSIPALEKRRAERAAMHMAAAHALGRVAVGLGT